MSTFSWNPQFETGLEEIDAQHRRLVATIDAFASRLQSGAEFDAAVLRSMYTDLASYAAHHFRTEATLMAEVGVDPRSTARHRHEHEEFTRFAAEMMARAPSEHGDAARALIGVLVHWLTYHILGSDHAMARQVRAIRAGADPAQAYADEERAVDPATATLLRSVTALFDTLAERNHELTSLAASLEEKVAERTRELAAANAELRTLLDRTEHLAMTDSLTGLPNRRYALERLSAAWAHASRHGGALSCLVVDADGFKQVNDQYGHEAGDAVLRAVAAALRDGSRHSDVVCRIGGDEFLIIAPDAPLAGALALGDRVRRSVARLRVRHGAALWRGSVSVGVAARTDGMADPEALVRAADAGVYAAKKAGRNAVRTAPATATAERPPAEARLPSSP